MGIYKLSFGAADGSIVDLPASMNKFTDVEALKAFAAEQGYDSKAWGEDHDQVLSEFFAHATVQGVDVEELAKKVTFPVNGDADYIIHGVNWRPFFDAVKKEPALFELPEHVFIERIQNGVLNGIIDGNGKLVGTMNVLPKLVNGMRAKLDIDEEPETQVYETATGWIAEAYRGLGLYTQTRQKVLESEGANEKLLFSQALGKGASNVNIREGWALIDPEQFPFASALMGWPGKSQGWIGQTYQLASGIEVDLPKGGVYQRKSSVSFAPKEDGSLTNPAKTALKHDWSEHYHLWTNDPAKAKRFETILRKKLRVPEKMEKNGKVSNDVVEHTYRGWLADIAKTLFYKEDGPTNGGAKIGTAEELVADGEVANDGVDADTKFEDFGIK